jgi:hypothetical protein
MLTAVRAALLAGLLLLPSRNHAGAVQTARDSSGLQFLGFRAGARLDELSRLLRDSGGLLRCQRSKIDRRVSECRGVLIRTAAAPRVEIWVSAIRVQGNQSMLQWVRRGRMMRLTWRLEGREKIASVSLVDGHVLDSWGRAKSRTAGPERT